MIVYKITNLINGKAYVGVTRHEAATRWKIHRAYVKRESRFPLHHAIAKYGLENFRFEVICECSSLQELAACERGLIAAHGTYTPNGYNITGGGEGCFERIVSDETRERLSRVMRAGIAEGRLKPPSQPVGYRHSDETRERMRRNHPHLPISADARAKISAANSGDKNVMRRDLDAKQRGAEKRRGQKRTPEQKAKMRSRALLTVGEVSLIKRKLLSGERASTIARQFGLGRSAIGLIKRGVTWADVPAAINQGE